MSMTASHIDFATPATLKKWPSLNGQRISARDGAKPYMIVDGTLDACIRLFADKPESQRHLYEIHTAPQAEIVTAVLAPEHVAELARLRDFL